MCKNNEKIYIYLLNEGTDCWKPAYGEKIGVNLYKILSTDNYNPDDEEWQFPPGSLVRCEKKKLFDKNKEDLIAVELAIDIA